MESISLVAKKCSKMSIFTTMMKRNNNLRVTPCFSREMSSSASDDHILVDLDSKTGIAVMKWNRKPVNSFSLEFAERSLEVLKSLELNKSCCGIVLTSAIPKVFSAGFDLFEIITYSSDRERVRKHVKAVANLVGSLRLTNLPIVAAVNGNAIAGGCIAAASCDYRVMNSTKGVIGVSEIKLGIPVSSVTTLMFANLMGHHRAELAIENGTLFKPEEALKVGLVDELADNEDDLLQKAISKAIEFASVPRYARSVVKSLFVSEEQVKMNEEQIDSILRFFTNDDVVANIQKMLANLKKS